MNTVTLCRKWPQHLLELGVPKFKNRHQKKSECNMTLWRPGLLLANPPYTAQGELTTILVSLSLPFWVLVSGAPVLACG